MSATAVSNTVPETSGQAEIIEAARELLVRTAELPHRKHELLAILSEYRRMVWAFAAER